MGTLRTLQTLRGHLEGPGNLDRTLRGPWGHRGNTVGIPRAVPELRGHLERGGLLGPAGQAAPAGQRDADRGPRREAAAPGPAAGPNSIPIPVPPLRRRRPQPLEEPEALGVRPGHLGTGMTGGHQVALGATWAAGLGAGGRGGGEGVPGVPSAPGVAAGLPPAAAANRRARTWPRLRPFRRRRRNRGQRRGGPSPRSSIPPRRSRVGLARPGGSAAHGTEPWRARGERTRRERGLGPGCPERTRERTEPPTAGLVLFMQILKPTPVSNRYDGGN